jgi:hypothetical protein
MSFLRTLLAAASLLIHLTSGSPQNGNRGPQITAAPNQDGKPGVFGAYSSCISACPLNIPNFNVLCGNDTALEALKTCVGDSDCEASDKDNLFSIVAQWCVNSGDNMSTGPLEQYATGVTSGECLFPT